MGPTADGFETYGVVQVALIAFIMLGAKNAVTGVQLLVWLFAVRVAMLVAAVAGYYINELIAKAKYGKALEFNFESPLTSLVWITSVVTIAATYPVTYILLSNLGGDPTLWWKLATITSCGTVAGALIPELVKVFTSTLPVMCKRWWRRQGRVVLLSVSCRGLFPEVFPPTTSEARSSF